MESFKKFTETHGEFTETEGEDIQIYNEIPPEFLTIPTSDIPPWKHPVSIREAYGDIIADTINDIVEGPDKDVQELWDKYKDEVLIFDPDYDDWGAWYDLETGAVTINMENCRQGGEIEPPYGVAFHEFGHEIDHEINKNVNGDSGHLFSETFKEGMLGKTAKAEAAEFIENYRLEMEKKEERIVSYEEACDKLSSDLCEKYTLMERADLSDIFEGATDGRVNLGAGHGKEYWKDHDNGTEIFAEMFSASICNKGSLNTIKEYFPKTHEVFKEMVRFANEQA
jgi:hypothetical protein